VVEGFEPIERIEIGLEGIGEPVDQLRPRTRIHAAPCLALEGGAGALHGAVDIFGGRVRDAGDHVAGRGIADVEHLAIAGLDLAAIDEVAVDFDVDRRRLGWNVHGTLSSTTMTALRLSAGSTRFSVWTM